MNLSLLSQLVRAQPGGGGSSPKAHTSMCVVGRCLT